jgi:hypothetical protein
MAHRPLRVLVHKSDTEKASFTMRLGLFKIWFVSLCCVLYAVSAVSACIKEPLHHPGLREPPIEVTYRQVLDLLFPCEAQGEYYLILRFLPSGTPESQIVISRTEWSTYELDYYFLPGGSKRVAEQIQGMIRQNLPDSPQELAKRIKVQHKKLRDAPPAVASLMTDYFSLKAPPQLDSRVVVDGTRYELWFITLSAQNVFYLSVEDEDPDGPVKNRIVNWMNRVKAAVDATTRR